MKLYENLVECLYTYSEFYIICVNVYALKLKNVLKLKNKASF